jgi:hypothetical protein
MDGGRVERRIRKQLLCAGPQGQPGCVWVGASRRRLKEDSAVVRAVRTGLLEQAYAIRARNTEGEDYA